MFNLIRNEWMKILNRPGTYVMAGLLIAVVMALSFILSYDFEEERTWQELIVEDSEYIQEIEITGISQGEYVEGQLAINDYRLANDLPPNSDSIWTYLDNIFVLITMVGLFTIIIASGIVASESSWGTIKLLMIRPIPRWKILLSKFITVATFGLAMIGILVTISVILGFILFDTGGTLTHLSYENGVVVEGNMLAYLMKGYMFKSINVILLATMSFMISAVFRNSSMALGISLFLYFVGGTATGFIAMYYDWAKYSLFANTDLSRSYPLVEGMTMTFSVIMILIYFALFVTLAFTVFTKRDIA
ncbi:ABC transporter permease subunit [Jeotgalibacillus marinus]|uniref:ABC transporter permease subunit n=1 Tax=Jeotgalibacillus marinus TaxID=86667 RepID=A0ABV3Q8B8_9BACL